MNDQNPAAVAQRYFDALAAGDLATAISLFGDAVAWHQPGQNRFSGIHTGVAAIQNLLGGMMEASEGSFRLSVAGSLMVNGDKVAVPVRFSGRRQGHEMDMAGIDLLTIQGGKITEVRLFSEDGPSEDSFRGLA